MKLAVLLLAIAGLLSWGAMTFGRVQMMPPRVDTAQTLANAPRALPRPAQQPSPVEIPAAPPLFRPATPISREPQPGDRLVLIGLAGRTESRVAFLRDAADGQTFTARAGDEIRNWRLEEANERCVVLRRARQRETTCLS